MRKSHCVYIMTNKWNTVLYTGVTDDLARRVGEHKAEPIAGFTSRYRLHKLVYVEQYDSARLAIHREQQLKAGPRRKKVELIRSVNPEWRDLSDDL